MLIAKQCIIEPERKSRSRLLKKRIRGARSTHKRRVRRITIQDGLSARNAEAVVKSNVLPKYYREQLIWRFVATCILDLIPGTQLRFADAGMMLMTRLV